MKGTTRAAAIVVAAIIAGACGGAEDRFLKRQLLPQEVAGRWVITHDDAKPLDGRDDTITIRRDGTCHVHSVDHEADCRWTLNHKKEQELFLWFTARGGANYYFDEENGRLLLWQYVDDPDAWRYIEYEKTP